MNTLKTDKRTARRFTLAHGFILSILIHAVLVFLWFAPTMFMGRGGFTVPNVERQTLNMDVFGMISDRQVIAIADIPELPEIPLLEPEPDPEPEPEPEPEPVKPPPETVKTPVADKKPQENKPVQAAQASQAPQMGQAGESIGAPSDQNVLQSYLAGVSRSIQSSLEYPQEAQDNGWIGEPMVSFMILEDGRIEPGSLKLAKSCGYPLLDQSALTAVQKRAPFSPPPRKITVTIAIAFTAK